MKKTITIILAVLSLTIDLGMGYALVFFFITYYLKWKRNKLEIVMSEKLKKQKEEQKTKKKTKKEEPTKKNTKKTTKNKKKTNK